MLFSDWRKCVVSVLGTKKDIPSANILTLQSSYISLYILNVISTDFIPELLIDNVLDVI